MSILRLYRGDSAKITEFSFNRTNKYCLFGPGIYLTDNVDVAHSYRTKGAKYKDYRDDVSGKNTWFTLRGCTKEDVYWEICKRIRDPKRRENIYLQKIDPDRQWINQEPGFVFHIVLGLIEKNILSIQTSAQRDFRAKPARSKSISVIMDFGPPKIGKLSVFGFDQLDFECSMIVSNRLSKHERTILDDLGISLAHGFSILGDNKEKRHNSKCQQMIRTFRSLGYRGIEYLGGNFIGDIRHRAFVVWDHKYVNQHRRN